MSSEQQISYWGRLKQYLQSNFILKNLLMWMAKFTNSISAKYIQELPIDILNRLTLDTHAYVMKKLLRGKKTQCFHLKLENLNQKEVAHVAFAYLQKELAYDLQVTYQAGVSDILKANMEHLFKNNLSRSILACITLQQGARDKNSIISLLPQEMLNKIYEFVSNPPFFNPHYPKTFVEYVSENPKNTNFKNKQITFFSAVKGEQALLNMTSNAISSPSKSNAFIQYISTYSIKHSLRR